MNQYKIIVTEYNEKGSLTNISSVYYRDTVEQAEQLYNQYKSQVQESGMKAYQVKLYTICYKNIADAEAFFDQFKA